MLVLGVLQIVVVVRDQLAIELAAREGARAAAVSASPDAAGRAGALASTGLRPISVHTSTTATRVRVTVERTTSALPLIGLVIRDVELSASVEMTREPP